MVSDGGIFESLMHAILYAKDTTVIPFGRPGKDAGLDARSADGTVIYQAKYRDKLDMDGAIALAKEELNKIKKYRKPEHENFKHWERANKWVLVANFNINPNDVFKWEKEIIPIFRAEKLEAEFWGIKTLDGELNSHPEIRDVFFGGENRVLVGLKEAHDILKAECVGEISLDKKMIGRESELETINNFVDSSDKRVLPVIGSGGIGKSRLLFEALILLSNKGWRVLWALPEAMSKSSNWFHLLNGNQQTCVVIDAPDDPGNLLRTILEQLSTNERRNWRVLFSCRTEKSEALHRLQRNKLVHKPIKLPPLDENQSQQLLKTFLDDNTSPDWLHSVYNFTKGIPGWLCLISDLVKKRKLSELPTKVDCIANIYVNSCLEEIKNTEREQAITILRWLSLWGVIKIDLGSQEQPEFLFLEKEKLINVEKTKNILQMLVKTGLVRNWGINKRLFAVEPMIVRLQILSDWLLLENNHKYEVSRDGKDLIQQMIEAKVYSVDSILSSLTHLAKSRLDDSGTEIFLRPIFEEFKTVVKEGDPFMQNRIIKFIEKIGPADPESALDVLAMIRKNDGPDAQIDNPFWGMQVYSHNDLMNDLPWVLYQIAEYVSDETVANRFIGEFRELVAYEDSEKLNEDSGKNPRQLLRRLLCESRNCIHFAEPAFKYVRRELTNESAWPFVGLVATCLLNPLRESMEWVANWNICFTRWAFVPGNDDWNRALDIRKCIYQVLGNSAINPDVRGFLWKVLSDMHNSFLRTVYHYVKEPKDQDSYKMVLNENLNFCAEIFERSSFQITLKEAEAARSMWKMHSKDTSEFKNIARRCENAYGSLQISKWNFHKFFDFEEDVSDEVKRIAKMLKKSNEPTIYTEFFADAKEYLDVVRKGKDDLADNWRITGLADVCVTQFHPEAKKTKNTLTTFVVDFLQDLENNRTTNGVSWLFIVRLCQRYLFTADEKKAGRRKKFEKLLKITSSPFRLLYGLYSNAHPDSLGTLSNEDLDFVLKYLNDFSEEECFRLLGVFAVFDTDQVQKILHDCLLNIKNSLEKKSEYLGGFIRSLDTIARRYKFKIPPELVQWIIEMIIEFELDGRLLEMYDLEWLRDQAYFRLDMVQFKQLIGSRIKLDENPKPYDDFEFVPHDFKVEEWVRFDENNEIEFEVFQQLCEMVYGNSFIALYWLPRYISQLAPSWQIVRQFVEKKLSSDAALDDIFRLAKLASVYSENSDAWVGIATPICEKAEELSKTERERVYFALENESGVLTSLPGQVPEYYVRKRDRARELYENETSLSLKPYRKWALERAEEKLRFEKERVEEVNNG